MWDVTEGTQMPPDEDQHPGVPWSHSRMGTNTPGIPQDRDQPHRDTLGQRAAPWNRVTQTPGWDPSPWQHLGTLWDRDQPHRDAPQHGDQHLGVPWRHPGIGTSPMGTPQDQD